VLPVGLFVLMALSQNKGLCRQAKAGNFSSLYQGTAKRQGEFGEGERTNHT